MENRFGTFGDNDSAKGSLFTERISNIGNELIDEHNAHIKNDIVSVKTFGAVGDGVTDDTIALINAINSHKTILLNNGTYLISGDIPLNSGSKIIGESMSSSIIKAADSSYIIATDKSDICLSNFSINGNGKRCGIAIESRESDISNITIERINVFGSQNAHNILIKKFYNYSIRDVFVSGVICNGAGGDGIGFGDNLHIASYGSDGNGHLTNVVISDCIFRNAGRNNISIAGDNSEYRPDVISINNCVIENSSLAGIDFEEVNKVTIANCHFINSGEYAGYYDGSHFAELNPESIMRSGISLHGDNNGVITNCTFTNCKFGICGNGNKLLITNSKFYDAKITDGTAAALGRIMLSNCELRGTDIDYLVSSYNGSLMFSNCYISGTTTSGYFVELLSGSSADSQYRENTFNHCVFKGKTDRSMSAIKIQYGNYEISNCMFNDFDKVFYCYAANSLVDLEINSNQIRNCNIIVSSEYASIENLTMVDSFCELIKQIASFSFKNYDMFFTDNVFLMKSNTEDLSPHIGINIPTAGGFRNLIFCDNFTQNIGTATDFMAVRANVRTTEIQSETVKICNNQFKNMYNAIGVYSYQGGAYTATNAIITLNQCIGVNTFIAETQGINMQSAIIEKNINGINIV